MTQDTVVVTQSAREAAASYVAVEPDFDRTIHKRVLIAQIEAGECDFDPIVQALAAAEQRGFKLCQDAAVKVAESAFAPGTGVGSEQMRAARKIASAIRTLSMETGNGE